MTDPRVFLNGQFLPLSGAGLTLHDAGFVFGATVTDLCRTFRHELFRLDDHLARFQTSCRLAHVPQNYSDAELRNQAAELVRHNAALLAPEHDLALVLFATPGPIGYYLGEDGGPGDGPPTFGMHTFPLPFARYRRLFREGAQLIVPSVRHLPAVSVDPRIKMRSRLFWWLADREVQLTHPGAGALLLDLEGHVTETAAANFLLVRQGAVLSPPRASILGGISLQVTQELCTAAGIPFLEKPLALADCQAGEEAFLTSTPYCLAPVSRINGHPLPCPGPLYRRLLAAWNDRVGLDIAAQLGASG